MAIAHLEFTPAIVAIIAGATAFIASAATYLLSRARMERLCRRLEQLDTESSEVLRLASLGASAGNAAHDILNPMNNITLRIEKGRKLEIRQEREDAQML